MSVPMRTRRPAPELGPDMAEYRLARAHGAMVGHVIPGDDVPTDAEVLAIVAPQQEGAEGCGCARGVALSQQPIDLRSLTAGVVPDRPGRNHRRPLPASTGVARLYPRIETAGSLQTAY